jgi:hypothetical protein
MSCINEAYKPACWTDEVNKSEKTKSRRKTDPLRMDLRISFSKAFPNLSFNDLKNKYEQIDGCLLTTNDGCTHYIHKTNNKTYSWNFIKREWTEYL